MLKGKKAYFFKKLTLKIELYLFLIENNIIYNGR